MRTFLKQRFAVALLAIGTTMALMTACGTANTDSLSKAERKRIQEMKVKEMLDNRHFKIEVDISSSGMRDRGHCWKKSACHRSALL